jgi:DNA-binding transcriptional regulator YiaG
MGWSKEEIRGFREEFELTQQQLGILLGVSQNYIFMLEAGIRRPGKPLMLLLDCVKEKLIQKRKEVSRNAKRQKRKGQGQGGL